MFGFLFGLQGRVSRKAMWLGFLLPYLSCFIAAFFADATYLNALLEPQIDPLAMDVIVSSAGGVAGLAMTVFWFWPSIATAVKRYHDRGLSGWRVVLAIVLMVVGVLLAGPALEYGDFDAMTPVNWAGVALFAIVTLWYVIGQYFLPGQLGPNRFGEDPADQPY
jgi:uncharacterized membrane protein YhaH (DUF805 family)